MVRGRVRRDGAMLISIFCNSAYLILLLLSVLLVTIPSGFSVNRYVHLLLHILKSYLRPFNDIIPTRCLFMWHSKWFNRTKLDKLLIPMYFYLNLNNDIWLDWKYIAVKGNLRLELTVSPQVIGIQILDNHRAEQVLESEMHLAQSILLNNL